MLKIAVLQGLSLLGHVSTATRDVCSILTEEILASRDTYVSDAQSLESRVSQLTADTNALDAVANLLAEDMAAANADPNVTQEVLDALDVRANTLQTDANIIASRASQIEVDAATLKSRQSTITSTSATIKSIILSEASRLSKISPRVSGVGVYSFAGTSSVDQVTVMNRAGRKTKVGVTLPLDGWVASTQIDLLVMVYLEGLLAKDVPNITYKQKLDVDDIVAQIEGAISTSNWRELANVNVLVDVEDSTIAFADGWSAINLGLISSTKADVKISVQSVLPFLKGDILNDSTLFFSGVKAFDTEIADLVGAKGILLSSQLTSWLSPETFASPTQLGVSFLTTAIDVASRFKPELYHMPSQYDSLVGLIADSCGQNDAVVAALLFVLSPNARQVGIARVDASMPIIWALGGCTAVSYDSSIGVLSVETAIGIQRYSVPYSVKALSGVDPSVISDIFTTVIHLSIGSSKDAGLAKMLSAISGLGFYSPGWVLFSLEG
jgi:hypothetical protein